MSDPARSIHRIIEVLLALVIIGVTLAFGGVQPLAYSLMEIAVFALFLALVIQQARVGRIQLPLPVWPVLFALLVILQIVPLPAHWISRIGGGRSLSAGLLAIEHRAGAWTTLSIYPHATWIMLMKFLAYLGAFIIAAAVFDSQTRKSVLVRVLVFLGLFEAAYGIVQYLANWQKIFWMNKVYYTSEATGTYINHNHFAGFIELTFPFMMASAFYYFQTWQGKHRRGPSRVDPAVASTAGIYSLLYGFFLIIAIVGVIFSRSRTGILATVLTVALLAILTLLKTRRKSWMIGLGAFLLIVLGYGLWIGLNPVVSRFQAFQGGKQYFENEGRLPVWQSTLDIIRAHPVVGAGLGTFEYSYRQVQSFWVTDTFTHAHNDYLELTAGTGVLGAMLLFVPIIILLILMIRSFITDTRRYRPAVTLACAGSTLAILIHSVADFNLHIPANALVFAVILGIGYKTACLERRAERSQTAPAEPAVVTAHRRHKHHHTTGKPV